MTKKDYLNTASDLKRIAYWVAVNDKNKLDLIRTLWKKARQKKDVEKIVRKYVGEITPGKAFKNDRDRIYFAEQVLISSLYLQNQAI